MESPKSARRGPALRVVSKDRKSKVRGGVTEVGEEVIGEVVAGAACVGGGDTGEEQDEVGSPCPERAEERWVAGLAVRSEMYLQILGIPWEPEGPAQLQAT